MPDRIWESVENCLPEKIAGWSALVIGDPDETLCKKISALGALVTNRPDEFLVKETDRYDLVLVTNAFSSKTFPLAWLRQMERIATRTLLLEFPTPDQLRDPHAVRRVSTKAGPRWEVGPSAAAQMLQLVGFDEVITPPYSLDDVPGANQNPPRILLAARHNAEFNRVTMDTQAGTDSGSKVRIRFLDESGNDTDNILCGDALTAEVTLQAGNEFEKASLLFLDRELPIAIATRVLDPKSEARKLHFSFHRFRLAPMHYGTRLLLEKSGNVRTYDGPFLTVPPVSTPVEGISHLTTKWQAVSGISLRSLAPPKTPPVTVGAPVIHGENKKSPQTGKDAIITMPDWKLENSPAAVITYELRSLGGYPVFSDSSDYSGCLATGDGPVSVHLSSLPLQPGQWNLKAFVKDRETGADLVHIAPAAFAIAPGDGPCPGLIFHDQAMKLSPVQSVQPDKVVTGTTIEKLVVEAENDVVFERKSFTIRATIRTAGNLHDEIIRFQILDKNGGPLLWGTNTRRAGISLEELSPGTYEVVINIPRCNLAEGRYLLRTGIWSSDNMETNVATCLDSFTISLEILGTGASHGGVASIRTHWQPVEQAQAQDENRSRLTLDLVDEAGSSVRNIKPNQPVNFRFITTGFHHVGPMEAMVLIDEAGQRLPYLIRLGASGMQIQAAEPDAILELHVGGFPLSPGEYHATAVLSAPGLCDPREDPGCVIARSPAIPFSIIGERVEALICLNCNDPKTHLY